MNGLKNKAVLITGATGGIGRATVAKMYAAGARVFATDQNESALAQLENDLQVETLAGNLLDAGFCDQLPVKVSQRLGGLDVLVNNAGIIRRGNVLDASDEDWSLSMGINVEAVFRLCRTGIAIMKEQGRGGAIVNVSSCWGLYPGPNHLVYCTTKAAVAAMTKCLARDHAPDQIRVNAVCPNEVNTPMLRTGFEIRGFDPDSAIDQLNQSVPLGRIAEPEDIANTITYLASEQAAYLCGVCVEINGAKPVY